MPDLILIVGAACIILFFAALMVAIKCYRKVDQGQALVRNGVGGTRVSFAGSVVLPVVHQIEYMDISVNRIEIDRHGQDGLICKDNMRADIRVAFFVRVNKTSDDVLRVAQTVGCRRASDPVALNQLFDAKFSEALKTVGRQFDFVELYNAREQFREEILKLIGTDLNGYVLDDAAIDHLEQTPLTALNPDNILDSEGIKKITELTAKQAILSNQIIREKEKVIRQQDVEAGEAILELNRQLAEAEEKQKREVLVIRSREEAETAKIAAEQRLKAEQARIAADEEIQIAEQNRQRQVIVAEKNKIRTEVIETERVEKDRLLEVTERNRIVALAEIEKTRAIETEQKKIQDVIRERVIVEKAVVEEKERIKDTEAFATADRAKKVAVTNAEMVAEEALIHQIKAAEASKKSAELKADEEMLVKLRGAEASRLAADQHAEEVVIEADAARNAAERHAEAKKLLASGVSAEVSAPGLGEAHVMRVKFESEAEGIKLKAEAMKIFDGVGREHEEFKLRLNKEKEIELAAIDVQRAVAEKQAEVMAAALKTAKIDIVGGDGDFFQRMVGAIGAGKAVDRLVDNSSTLKDIKATLLGGDGESFRDELRRIVGQLGLSSADVKNLTVAAALAKLSGLVKTDHELGLVAKLETAAEALGWKEKKVTAVI